MNKKIVIISLSIVGIILLGIIFFIVNFESWFMKYKDYSNTNTQTNNTILTNAQDAELKDLPQNYPAEQAAKDGCFVIANGNKIYNKEKLDSFILNTGINSQNRKEDKIRIVYYTVEGDAIITDLEYKVLDEKYILSGETVNKTTYIMSVDNTRDKWSTQEDRKITINSDIPGDIFGITTSEKEYTIEVELALYAQINYVSPDAKIYENIMVCIYSKNATIEEYTSVSSTEGISNVLTLDDKIQDNTTWCGTFQLIWNDLKNDLAKQDIVFEPQLEVVKNLNKETFTTSDLSEKYYYKKIGTPSIALKQEIEKAIKDKFNETSDILDDFDWSNKGPKDYFLYVMLKKEFEFETEFEQLENGNFGNYENVKYFGIKKEDENSEARSQIKVLYYNSSEDFAIELKTKQEDKVILCKKPKGNTFNEIYSNIENNQKDYKGKKYIEEGELVKIPNIKVNEKKELTEIENKAFKFSNGYTYRIEKALQTIKFELDKTGGKIKSEAGMMVKKESIMMPDETREFAINDTFAIFLKEEGKSKPYFAGKIGDITKFQ